MARDNPRQAAQVRQRLAQQAAQLMAEHGIRDFALAKKKAARQLGLDPQQGLPSNIEVEEALRSYHSLFDPEFGEQTLQAMREQALAVMQTLARFEPELVGGVANGSATRHADIELEVFLEASKDLERFLLNADFAFTIEERPGQSIFRLAAVPCDVLIRVLPESLRHQRPRSSAAPRFDARRLQALLDHRPADEGNDRERHDG